jgi:hypothetical protein
MFGSTLGNTNITVIEFSTMQKQLWIGGATYDDNFAGGAGLGGGINEYVPYIAKYNFADRNFQWARSIPNLIGDFIVNMAVQPDGKYIAAHTYSPKSYILVIDYDANIVTAHTYDYGNFNM